MFAIFKKEYRLGLILLLVFALFLFTVDKTSMDIIYSVTGIHFWYSQKAFLKLLYFVLLVLTIAFLNTLDKSEYADKQEKGKAFRKFMVWSVISFFPGWGIHLFAVIQAIKMKSSITDLAHHFWIYNAADFTLFLGFCLAALLVLKPVIHPKEKG